MTSGTAPARPAFYDKEVALVFQGGGALGSYQAGLHESLADSEYLPDCVAGISIGAINAAIIAGNPPETRVAHLRRFWDDVTAPSASWPAAPSGPLALMQSQDGALAAALFGQPGFFAPCTVLDRLPPQQPTSSCSTRALKSTLERLVDFDRINYANEMRFSVAAVNVRTGHFAYFDSAEMRIRPEHVMASGALPAACPPVEIDGECYCDGGLVSNTPLPYVVDYYPRRSRLSFQVDLFQGRGRLPTNLEEVSEREKDIRYSSRTRISTDALRQRHEMRHAINELHWLLPPDIAAIERA